MGVDGPMDVNSLLEYRGHSYAIGRKIIIMIIK